ncbi:MAG: alpha-E domain-containing protein [Granulosicoccus sp.]
MLARVAENIYWLNRYLERAENTVRLIDVHSRMMLDHPDIEDHAGWIPVITINAMDKEFAKKYDQASESTVCNFLLADQSNPGSLSNAFIAIQNNLRCCRDIVPRSSYEAINSTCRFVRQQVESATTNTNLRNAFLASVKTRLLAISGDINSNMSHDIGYRFMRMGCHIERADMTSRIIDVQSSTLSLSQANIDNMALRQQSWVAVLRSLSAMQMYRQHVHQPVNGHDTLRFLLLDDKLPRAYTFCIDHIDSTLRQFKRHAEPLAAIELLRQQLNCADLNELSQQPVQLHQHIDKLQIALQNVATAIADTYFLPPQDT